MKKKALSIIMALCIAISCAATASAKITRTKSYIKHNGTYVKSHYKTSKNHTKLDNWSTKGNRNPITGKKGTKSAYKY